MPLILSDLIILAVIYLGTVLNIFTLILEEKLCKVSKIGQILKYRALRMSAFLHWKTYAANFYAHHSW